MTSDEWRSRASCLSVDPEVFFPPDKPAGQSYELAAARAVCSRCPVSSECLSWAASARVTHGVWGGLLAREIAVAAERPARQRAS